MKVERNMGNFMELLDDKTIGLLCMTFIAGLSMFAPGCDLSIINPIISAMAGFIAGRGGGGK